MTTVSTSLFDTVTLDQPPVRVAASAAAAKAAPKSKATGATTMPASLWRHTQNEEAAESRHGVVARSVCCLFAVLGFGSIAYAAWQTCTLLSGDGLHQAISAFLR